MSPTPLSTSPFSYVIYTLDTSLNTIVRTGGIIKASCITDAHYFISNIPRLPEVPAILPNLDLVPRYTA